MIVQYVGKTANDTARALCRILDLVRKHEMDVEVGPVDGKLVCTTGIWIRGAQRVVDGLMDLIIKAGIKGLPARYTGGK